MQAIYVLVERAST